MSPPHVHEERALHYHMPSDARSIRSLASSSSTVTSSPMTPTEEKYNFEATSEPQYLPPPHWRKTPLTRRGLFCLLLRILAPLLPSFLRREHPPKPPRKLHPTSYLDGLRGVAAFIVFIDHFAVHWFENIKSGYLASPEDAYLIQLPILRLVYTGRASVGVFFVISGFVLSYKALLQIRSSQHSAVLQTLSSSVLRRGLRLYLPIIAGTFISAILAYNKAYTDVPTRLETLPPIFPTFSLQYKHWLQCTYDIVFPFNSVNPNAPYSPPYNGHLWTIPIELYGSIVVFLVVLMLSQVRSTIRMTLVAWLALWCLGKQRWDLFLFLSGTFLAELSLPPCSASDLPWCEPLSSPHIAIVTRLLSSAPVKTSIAITQHLFHLLKTPGNIALLFLSLYILSYPGDGFNPGIYHLPLQPFTPAAYTMLWYGAERFFLSLGSVLLIFAILHSPATQKLFCAEICQYLGDISYSLYIIHGMVLFTLGTGLMQRWTGAVGVVSTNPDGGQIVVADVADSWQYEKSFVMCAVLNLCVAVWAADVFWRGVDVKSVRLARRVEGWLKH